MGSIMIKVLSKRLWSSSLHRITTSTDSPRKLIANSFERFLVPLSCDPQTFSSFARFESTKSQGQLLEDFNHDSQALDFPGGTVAFTSEMRFIPEASRERIPCYRVLDDNGNLIMHSSYVEVLAFFFTLLYVSIVETYSKVKRNMFLPVPQSSY